MDGPRNEHTKSESERQITYDITYMWTLKKNDANELISKTESNTQTNSQAKGKRGQE